MSTKKPTDIDKEGSLLCDCHTRLATKAQSVGSYEYRLTPVDLGGGVNLQ